MPEHFTPAHLLKCVPLQCKNQWSPRGSPKAAPSSLQKFFLTTQASKCTLFIFFPAAGLFLPASIIPGTFLNCWAEDPSLCEHSQVTPQPHFPALPIKRTNRSVAHPLFHQSSPITPPLSQIPPNRWVGWVETSTHY